MTSPLLLHISVFLGTAHQTRTNTNIRRNSEFLHSHGVRHNQYLATLGDLRSVVTMKITDVW